ncbi:hypothetical protein Tcan_14465 [Toxocara canis]|uniref:Uncharacterized protein n=1 Tax=Toxocara canis TaxID=6265 RepID=A0A0B2VJH8_TOXCA|nr:hypothetical protein Tcan_14465 [Toxocara canis]
MTDLNIPVALSGETSHTIFSATDPNMYDFLPMADQLRELEMFETTSLWIGTKEMKEKILANLIRCALIKNCISPVNAKRACNMQKLRERQYADCHRHDQSAMNIILGHYTKYRAQKYHFEHRQWFVERGGVPTNKNVIARLTSIPTSPLTNVDSLRSSTVSDSRH